MYSQNRDHCGRGSRGPVTPCAWPQFLGAGPIVVWLDISARLFVEQDPLSSFVEDTNTGEEHTMGIQIRLLLLFLGILSAVNGCDYVEPPPPAAPAPPAYGSYGAPYQGEYSDDDRRARTVSKHFVSSMSDWMCTMVPVSPIGPDGTSA
jgi:hypothetical protein